MDKLDELQKALKEYKAQLEKADVKVAPEGSKNRETYEKEFEKKEDCDEEVDEAIDEHEDEKHSAKGHAKEHEKMKDKGLKKEVNTSYTGEANMVKMADNGQWSLDKEEQDSYMKMISKKPEHMQSEHGSVKEIDPKTGKTKEIKEVKGVKLQDKKKD